MVESRYGQPRSGQDRDRPRPTDFGPSRVEPILFISRTDRLDRSFCSMITSQDAPWKGFHEAIQYDYASEADKKRGVTTTKAVMVCKQCRHTMLHPYEKVDKSNSSLWKHYRKHDSEIPLPPMTQSTIDNLFPRPSNISGSELQRLLLETTVTCNWSFDQFEVEVFRYFIIRGYSG